MIKFVHIYVTPAENWYSHISKTICYYEDITVLWNEGVQTDTEVLANRSDIIIKNKTDKMCLLIDVVMPSDRSVIQRKAERNENIKPKYRNLVKVEYEILRHNSSH
jgi:hypothetical protein